MFWGGGRGRSYVGVGSWRSERRVREEIREKRRGSRGLSTLFLGCRRSPLPPPRPSTGAFSVYRFGSPSGRVGQTPVSGRGRVVWEDGVVETPLTLRNSEWAKRGRGREGKRVELVSGTTTKERGVVSREGRRRRTVRLVAPPAWSDGPRTFL